MSTSAGNTQSSLPASPDGDAQRIQKELDASRKALKDFHERGSKVVRAFLDEEEEGDRAGLTKWNLFWSNVTMQLAMLFGNLPRVDVSRRFADSEDEAGRIGGELQERLLNTDIERDSDTTTTALGYALQDWRIPGLGFVRLRYVAEFEPVPVPEGQPPVLDEETGEPAERVTSEDVEVDYVYWKDVLWSPARVWHEVRWIDFPSDISREKAVERFGEAIGNALPVHPKKERDEPAQPWDRVRIHEVWDKERRCVYWYCEGFPNVLDHKPDPLGLDGFWPCARPLMANLSTTKLVPKADYLLAQDQYRAINNLSTRIEMLQDAVKVSGLYNKDCGEDLAALFNANTGNKLIPVSNWALFGEKGGIKGQIDWLPLEQVVGAIQTLVERRREEVDALHEVTGQSDLMRGMSSVPGESATAAAGKLRSGSVRIDYLKSEFARFTTDTLRLKAEIISKHFRPETILQRSNAQYAFAKEEEDKPGILQAAVELVKSRFSDYRLKVDSDALAMQDFAALRSEKVEIIGGVSQYLTSAAPLAQAVPGAMPYLLEILQNLVAGMKGAATLEGTLDRAIDAAQKQQEAAAAAGPQEDAAQAVERMKAQTAQVKVEGDLRKEEVKLQNDLVRIQAETQSKAQQESIQREENVREAAQKQMVANTLKPPPPAPTFKPGGPR